MLASVLELHTEKFESPTSWPSYRTLIEKNATVEIRSKFQLGYPIVGSPRLPAVAYPNTSRRSAVAFVAVVSAVLAPPEVVAPELVGEVALGDAAGID